MLPIPQISIDNSFIFSIILGSIFLLGLLRAFYWKYTRLMLSAPFQYRYASQYLRQDNAFTERVSWIAFLILILNFSLLLIFNKSYYSFFGSYFSIFLSVSSFYLLKYLILNFLGKMLFAKEISRLTVFYSFLSDKALGIIITPFVLILFFFAFNINHIILAIILFFSVCLFVFKLYWIWQVGTNSFGLSSVYIFLYLCILEIYPFVFIAKGFFY